MSERKKPAHPRKTEITHAAVTCFLERGYHQTGVRDIASQAGVSLGNLYNHFKGKEAILAFIAELEGEELSEVIHRLSDPADPRAAMEQFMQEYEALVSRPVNAILGIEILTESLRNTAIREVFEGNRRQLVDAMTKCLTKGFEAGAFGACVDARVVALAILDALEGHGLRSLSDTAPNAASGQALRAYLLKGLEKKPESK